MKRGFERLAGYAEENEQHDYDTESMAEITPSSAAQNNNNNMSTQHNMSTENEATVHPWPQGTICVLGDSQLNKIDERKLGKNVKVRNHSGAVIEDMFDHVNAVLRRKPSAIILHVGTNNSPQQDYVTIGEKIVSLRQYINSKLPSCKVIYSSMFLRKDNVMANDNLQRANSLLKEIYTDLSKYITKNVIL